MILLVVARVLVGFVPFRHIIARSSAHAASNAVTALPTARHHIHKARHTRKVIARARRSLPFEVNCFPQALVAIYLLSLRRVPYSLFFGVRRNDGAFQAHAWVVCGPITVCGDCASSEYQIISTYTHPAQG